MRVLIACECSGVIRSAFRKLGHEAWSCDIQPADDGSPFHIQDDVRNWLRADWELMIAHPECTRLTNAGVRWLIEPPEGFTLQEMWDDLKAGAEFYRTLRDAPIKRKAIENPVMHKHARELILPGPRQVVQPWFYGDPFFKATGLELYNLPPLRDTKRLIPPKKGTKEHKEWSAVHMASPGPNRAKERSRSFPGMAQAMAEQWAAPHPALYSTVST
jgi:hypothetical protein